MIITVSAKQEFWIEIQFDCWFWANTGGDDLGIPWSGDGWNQEIPFFRRPKHNWLVVTGTWMDDFSIYWEFHHPNWRTPSFSEGWVNHQPEIVLNRVTGVTVTKLVDFHSVGQNKVCAEDNRNKNRMQAPKEIIQNKYLQHLTTAHWAFSTAAVGVGHDHGQLLANSHSRNNLHSSILQFLSFLFENIVFNCVHVSYFSWSLVFKRMMLQCIYYFYLFADKSLAGCSQTLFSMTL